MAIIIISQEANCPPSPALSPTPGRAGRAGESAGRERRRAASPNLRHSSSHSKSPFTARPNGRLTHTLASCGSGGTARFRTVQPHPAATRADRIRGAAPTGTTRSGAGLGVPARPATAARDATVAPHTLIQKNVDPLRSLTFPVLAKAEWPGVPTARTRWQPYPPSPMGHTRPGQNRRRVECERSRLALRPSVPLCFVLRTCSAPPTPPPAPRR